MCEQKRQGSAAVDAAYWTWAQFVAGLVGLGAVLVTLGFSVIATFSAKSAAEAAREQVELSRRNAEKTQRAFVYFKSHKLAPIPDSRFYELETVFYNSGATPAKNCFHRVNWQRFPIEEFPDGVDRDFEFPELAAGDGRKESIRFFIGPTQERSGGNCEIPSEYIGSILRRTHRILIWGWVEYDDVFGDTPRHRTEFCYTIDLDRTATGAVGVERIRFVTYHRHNGSDEECLKPVQTSRSGASRIVYGTTVAKPQPADSGAS